MEQIVVKLEDQSNGEILLYYVDENGDNQEGVLTTIENIENPSIQLQDNSYILGNLGDIVDEDSLTQPIEEQNENNWTIEDIKRLLIFYNDNKPSFVTGTTQRKHLWTVACKTMLIGKNHETCESKLQELQYKYFEVRNYVQKGVYVKWPYFDICHEAFHDENASVTSITELEESKIDSKPVTIINQETKKDDIVTVRHVDGKNPEVIKMLKLYIKYKANFQKGYWRREIWEKIAKEMGENDWEFLQKRFLNYKQHYIKMLEKKKESPSSFINWPYMELFDKIFEGDSAFLKKNFNTPKETEVYLNEWNNIQITVLAKYYYETYEEFEDPTIPNKFLWTEVSRLIDKTPEQSKEKFESMKQEHLDKYISGNYKIEQRIPVSIIYDHIIAKYIKKELSNKESIPVLDPWKTTETDELVQFIYDNTILFKDSICHFVCWAALCKKLKRDLISISSQWKELSMLYNSILEDKKENPDMQIDWRYIDQFDLIFDYGMDLKFLKGFEDTQVVVPQKKESAKVGVKKLTMDSDVDSDKDYTPDSAKKVPEPRTDPRSTKILEFYLKNKDKSHYMKRKVSLWDPLAKEIGLNSTQCAHRFRSLRQTYLEFVQKEIDQPKVPVTWPYYGLCKKIFGYRSVKSKLKQGHIDNGDWLAREIKQLISFFSKNFHDISNNVEDLSKWGPLAAELGKSEINCKDKFMELRKCYRKLKTMKTRNPGVKISWSYFDMFDRIYTAKEESSQLDALNEQWPEEYVEEEAMEEDDYQCIIVLPEGQDLSTINNSQIIIPATPTESEENGPIETVQQNFLNKWTKRTKKLLLIHYINYIRSHRGKEIIAKDMWKHISSKMQNRSPVNCRKMFLKLKNSFKNASEETKLTSPLTNLLEKVLKLKPKFSKESKVLKEGSYKNVELPHDKIHMALKYYLEHIEEFVNPKFDQKYLWSQLANHISEPITKVHNKINYLKNSFNIETEEINNQKTEFSQLLKDIIVKEVTVKSLFNVISEVEYNENETDWNGDEIEKLLNWYLCNLDKFKNPKFDRSYLWIDAATILNKSPVICSKKMSEIRTLYRNMVKENSAGLAEWRFLDLCQKIYGTGKKGNVEYMQ